ncbi:hypothetical protein [Nocardia pseudovaccinii]|uniref:hypothetical protein n=1 Tax=Nocardia pseudovaccinii TaxID=189540 RepID=UPI0007A3BC55|nr:hypothetical protein [Nocardia pseudovaccinii]
MPELTPLEQAIEQAIAFAEAHGVDVADLTRHDFGIQRSDPGFTHANHVSPTHVIAVTIGGVDGVNIGVAELDWIHYPIDDGCARCEPDECDACGADPCACEPAVPMTTVYLPGDAPAEERANA